MTSIAISVAVEVATFGLGTLGLYLKRLLPERHMSTGSREMIGAIMGLVTLLLALVLGTLVGSAWGFFATQKANIETLCARSLELDLAFRQYGPETRPLREALRTSMAGAENAIWGDGATYQQQFDVGAYMSRFEKWNETLSSLSPHTPAQTQLAFVHERQLRRLSADAAPHLSAIGEPGFLAPAPHCGVLGDAAVLRIWSAFRPQRHELRRACLWLVRRRERDLSDLGAQPAVYRPVPHSGRVYGANDCGAKRVTDFKMNILEACCRARRGAQYRRKGGQG